jgi:hypothetical protein
MLDYAVEKSIEFMRWFRTIEPDVDHLDGH